MAPAISEVCTRAAGEQDDHGDQSDAGPIDAQTGKPPQSHSGIGGGEDSQDEEGHVGRVQVSLGRGVEVLHNTRRHRMSANGFRRLSRFASRDDRTSAAALW